MMRNLRRKCLRFSRSMQICSRYVHAVSRSYDDEAVTLWGQRSPLPSTASECLNFRHSIGCDPTLHSLFGDSPHNLLQLREDFWGANLCFPHDPAHEEESQAQWKRYFRNRYLTRLRLRRRSGVERLGVLTEVAGEDVADLPKTTWQSDPHFTELVDAVRPILGSNQIRNMQQLANALLSCTPEQLCAFAEKGKYLVEVMAPIPIPSYLHYEGETLKNWSAKYQPMLLESRSFRDSAKETLNETSWKTFREDLSGAVRKINEVRLSRLARQMKNGLIRDWKSMTEQEKLSFCTAEIQRFTQSISGGEIDPEDQSDKSEEWLKEQQEIETIAGAKLASMFSFHEFWKNIIRPDEIVLLHLLDSPHMPALCMARAIDHCNGDFKAYFEQIAQSYQKSELDETALRIVPQMNDVWVMVNWYKFGGTGAAADTAMGLRQLLFHRADVASARAAAMLYYKLQIDGSFLDMSSPFSFRKSIVDHHVEYAVALAKSSQSGVFECMEKMHETEHNISLINWVAGHTIGESRRRASKVLQEDSKQCSTTLQLGDSKCWHLGSKANLVSDFGGKQPTRLIISLFRKVDVAKQQELIENRLRKAKQLMAENEDYKIIWENALETFELLGGTKASHEETPSPQCSGWDFVTVLDDTSCSETVELLLPYSALAMSNKQGGRIPEGEYCVKIRGLKGTEPIFEVSSVSFVVKDVIKSVEESFFNQLETQVIPPQQFVPYIECLRGAGIEVSLETEFRIGQVLTVNGEIIMENLRNQLYSQYDSTAANGGYSDGQLAAEPKVRKHWELYHPGATDYEWFCVRRHELEKAFENEREWWRKDETLHEAVAIANSAPVLQYGHDVVSLLSAEGKSEEKRPLVSTEMNGMGSVISVKIDRDRAKEASIDEILQHTRLALTKAHNRVNSLAAVKLNDVEVNARLAAITQAEFSEFSGKYARTHHYAFAKAQEDLHRGVEEPDVTDRFASNDNYELRRRLFKASIGRNQENIDDPLPDHVNMWKTA